MKNVHEEGKATRYNMAKKKMKKIQNIQMDKRGQELYSHSHYITEYINVVSVHQTMKNKREWW